VQGVKNKHLIIDGIEMKQCSRCELLLSIGEFYKSKITSDGLRSACKQCEQKENATKYSKNREKEISRVRAWQAKNPDRVKEIDRRRQKPKRNAWRREWLKRNPEKAKEYEKRSYGKLKANGHLKAYQKKWREEINREAHLAIHRKANNKKRNDPKWILDRRISSAIRCALKGNKEGRKWESIVGYTLDDLYQRLTETMPESYTWDDLLTGVLHIDHVVPKSWFNYKNETALQFKKCWGLNNLQLLPAYKNISKGNRYVGK